MSNTLEEFKNLVGIKFEMYNSLFTSLPFHRVEKTGILLSLFLLHCEEGFRNEQSPAEIINSFFKQYTTYRNEKEQIDLLFRFIQYSERQVVLFDALEDAAFSATHDMNGAGTLKQLQSEVIQTNSEQALAQKLKDFSVRMVLTAHPNQFYPREVLGIIHDLGKALYRDDTVLVNTYLQQLGKTPFFKKQKPTPYDEAVNLIWFLENVFYQSAGRILSFLYDQFPDAIDEKNQLIRMGFWPGGDRDGNPFVKADTTLKVAEALRGSIIKCYYRDVRLLKGRLTFQGVDTLLATLEDRLYKNLFIPGYNADLSKDEITDTLIKIRSILIEKHNSLFLNKVNNLLNKVNLFGLFFASLDIRQDSSIHRKLVEQISEKTSILPRNYKSLSQEAKIQALQSIDSLFLDTDLDKETFDTLMAIKTIQKFNGPEGCHRYIISHTTSALDVMEVYGLCLMTGWKKEKISIDFVPLFETIGDLQSAGEVMRVLYENEIYLQHLKRRNSAQTIMLGFSDGTKDGGYLMANWSIYKAKEELTRISREYDVKVVFFDGRGGPPARGGGKTHQFYASMGKNIANKEIQLTIQGQTISSNFGTMDAARYNMEQLMHSGISNALFSSRDITLSKQEEELLQELSDESYEAFNVLKENPDFLEYLDYASPLRYYAEANIGSRPSKRKSGKLNLNDLRAVPYVGAWSQLKQNLPGYYGVGIAFEKLAAAGKWEDIRNLYRHSLYFKTLIDNCEMAMSKCFFPLTAYLSKHPKYGELWNMFHDEFERTRKYVLLLTGKSDLMGDKAADKLSIHMRQRIELPLITIQQYALTMIREGANKNADASESKIFEKLVMRCSFGIINAERNSA
ncbi:phosphoenolpyruvate carboxylase [Daejeonella sp. H1SJ63]|jgi:phosphoenolpyruvate carboxylase|uniref:phosphoenolpyruvate carboxylase n=1 Tax=Daejeonella sp. H1SJ63 TaxID=3034145 RepID=UPI0023EC9916|nr:phosphoenolpyruvate carboxylase [Daejeonella sp. H1SJ63]